MMKHYSPKPLQVILRPSYLLAGGLGLAGTAACALPAWPSVPLWLRLAWGGIVVVATAYHVARDALRCLPWSIVALQVDSKNVLHGRMRSGQEFVAVLLGDSYVTSCLTVLNLRPQGKRLRRAIVLLPDAVEADSYRRLRVWLKWGRGLGDTVRG